MTDPPDDDHLHAQLEALHGEGWSWALACCAGDAALAEEVLHVSYHKILSRRASFNGRSSFKTWLFGVVRLTSADHRRWTWRRWARWAPLAEAESHPADGADASESLVLQERCEEVRAALKGLAARQAEVLRLVFYHELTLDDAAAVMGISPGSARTHYDRGKQRLRQRLNHERFTP
jgi:RNA polymerase sigma factor (sigma-70 family)